MPAVDYEQLARFYDAMVRSEDDVAFFVELARQADGKLVELMAGTGRVAVAVAAAGVDLTCVDSSTAMLERLREKLRSQSLSAEVVCQDVTDLDLESRFALAYIAFNSFEELTTDSQRQRLLSRVRRHLVPDGRFVCNLHDPEIRLRDVGPGRDKTWRFRDPDEDREVLLRLSTAWDDSSSQVHGRQTLEDAASGEVMFDLSLRFRLTPAAEFRSLVEEAGFRVEALAGGFAGEPYEEGQSTTMIWTLSSRGEGN